MLCVKYARPGLKNVDLNEVPQIKIEYDPKDETLEEFIDRYKDKHIYIQIINKTFFKTLEDMNRFKALKEKKNWSLIVSFDDVPGAKVELLKEICNNYIFSDMVDEWEDLQELLNYGVSEVYITNMLGFDLERVKRECDKRQVKLRAVANFAQCRNDAVTPAIKRFFIRPEDIEYYNDYLYGIEFVGEQNVQEVCWKAYSRGYWYGDLSELIIGLGTDLDSRRLPKNFGSLRAICGKRCITGGGCSVCRTMTDFVEIMEKTDSMIDYD